MLSEDLALMKVELSLFIGREELPTHLTMIYVGHFVD
jgi:hypothetical protein